MKKAFLFLLVTIITGFILSTQSCKEKENQAPVVTVDEPTNGETISLGDSIHIEFTATDDEELHEASVIIKSHMGDTVFTDYPVVHALKTYDYHEHFVPADTGMFHIHINVADHDDKTTSKEIEFNVIP